eukprot:scaffold25631_cov54-Phaeocystis_antarctica.AAC.2
MQLLAPGPPPPATDRQALRTREATYTPRGTATATAGTACASTACAGTACIRCTACAATACAGSTLMKEMGQRPSFLPPPLFMFWRDWVLL